MSEMTVKLRDARNEFLKCYLDEYRLHGTDCTSPEGQTGEAWESSKQSSHLDKGQHLIEQYFNTGCRLQRVEKSYL